MMNKTLFEILDSVRNPGLAGIRLDDLTNDDFVRVVSADVKRVLPHDAAEALKAPEIRESLISALEQLLSEVDSKIAQREADVLDEEITEAEFKSWIAKTLYFRTSVEKRLAVAKRSVPKRPTRSVVRYEELLAAARLVTTTFEDPEKPDNVFDDTVYALIDLVRDIDESGMNTNGAGTEPH